MGNMQKGQTGNFSATLQIVSHCSSSTIFSCIASTNSRIFFSSGLSGRSVCSAAYAAEHTDLPERPDEKKIRELVLAIHEKIVLEEQ